MPIRREWRAEIRRALKDEYVAYDNATGMVGYRQTPGISRAHYYPEGDRFLQAPPEIAQHYDSTRRRHSTIQRARKVIKPAVG